MMNWTFNPEQYTEKNFKALDEGDYRVRISDVTYKEARNGHTGIEIKLDVSGKAQKLWHYIWFDESNERLTNQRLGELFNSFDIKAGEQDNIDSWIGKDGGVRVKHVEYDGRMLAKVSFCLNRKYQEKLPAWKDKPTTKYNDKTQWYEDLPSSNVKKVASIAPREFGGLSF